MFYIFKSLMKTFLLILLLISSRMFAIGGVQWTLVPRVTTNTLHKGCFTDSLNGWAVGINGTIIHTSNGGNTWVLQNSNTDFNIISVSFINSQKGFAISNSLLYSNPVIFNTTNGGINWDYVNYFDTTQVFNVIKFVDSSTGFIGGYGGLILKTTDGGLNWNKTQNDTMSSSNYPIRDIEVCKNNSNFVFASGGQFDLAGVFWKSSDFGNTWNSKIASAEPLFDLFVIDTNNIIGLGGDFEYGSTVYRTTNRGLNWSLSNIPYFGLGMEFAERTQNEWWIAFGYSLYLPYSTDAGNSWQLFSLPDSIGVNDVLFIDSTRGFTFGQNGYIQKYTGTNVRINQIITEIPDKFILYQNYPNPFNQFTIINVQCSIKNYVTLKIFDMRGREVTTILNGTLEPGIHKVIFDAKELSSGIYFYKLTAGNITQTKKLILLK